MVGLLHFDLGAIRVNPKLIFDHDLWVFALDLVLMPHNMSCLVTCDHRVIGLQLQGVLLWNF